MKTLSKLVMGLAVSLVLMGATSAFAGSCCEKKAASTNAPAPVAMCACCKCEKCTCKVCECCKCEVCKCEKKASK